MAFGLQLEQSLDRRHDELESEFESGMDLRAILSRHLLAVENAAETELRTSVLLLEHGGRRLRHGAAPNLPKSYCEAIDGSEIGPQAGSCGTAAFLRCPIYVTDIESDPLWADYREVALEHGLRACWSTPIFDEDCLLGTFAIYHPTPRSPTPAEVESIALIADRVARAIKFDRDRSSQSTAPCRPYVTLTIAEPAAEPGDGESDRLGQRLGDCAERLRTLADNLDSRELVDRVQSVARDCEALVRFIRKDGTVC